MIEISNFTTNVIDEHFVKKVIQKVLKGEKVEDGNLSVAFVGQGRIKALNWKYRGKNRTTDVLAFSEKDVSIEPLPSKIFPFQEKNIGEIIISLKNVKKNARRRGVSVDQELAEVIIHGVLHLLGYDHERSKEEEKKMLDKQKQYLEQLSKELKFK